MQQLRPAASYDADTLTALLNGCYDGYFVPTRYQPHEYEFFVRAHDVDLAHSVVAEMEGRAVGVAQISRRGERGWVAGVGVLPDVRRQGIARHMMQALSFQAAAVGIRRLQLEVLCQNQAALDLYLSLGWKIERELWIWRLPAVPGGPAPTPATASVDPSDLLSQIAEYRSAWGAPQPCWQRQPETLRRYLALHLQGWMWPVLEPAARLPVLHAQTAYALAFPPFNDRLRLADVIQHPSAPPEAGRGLLEALRQQFPAVTIHLLNEPADSPLTPALAACGGEVVQRQHEMSLWL